MSLDLWLEETRLTTVFDTNITHNLGPMAQEAGIYSVLWHPEDVHITKAQQMIVHLEAGLALLRSDPQRFRKLSSPNGWGRYEHFVPFVERVLAACRDHPSADVKVSR